DLQTGAIVDRMFTRGCETASFVGCDQNGWLVFWEKCDRAVTAYLQRELSRERCVINPFTIFSAGSPSLFYVTRGIRVSNNGVVAERQARLSYATHGNLFPSG